MTEHSYPRTWWHVDAAGKVVSSTVLAEEETSLIVPNGRRFSKKKPKADEAGQWFPDPSEANAAAEVVRAAL